MAQGSTSTRPPPRNRSPCSAPPPPSAWASTGSSPGERIWVGDQWFYLAGILNPAVLAPGIDSSVLVGFPAAEKYLGFDGHPSTIYVRAQTSQVDAVHSRAGRHRQPGEPQRGRREPTLGRSGRPGRRQGRAQRPVPRPRAVALLVGAVGVANIMVISVLERRSEIGLRRALGATKGNIRIQFLSEAILLALLGGTIGVGVGGAATAIYANAKRWAIVIPPLAWAGGFGAAVPSAPSPACCRRCGPPACHPPTRCGPCDYAG